MSDTDILISSESLRQRLSETSLRIVDCRFDLMQALKGQEDYLNEHIPGAIYADLDRDLSAPIGPTTGRHPLPTPDVFNETMQRLGIDADSQVVAYDQGSGAIAARLWWMLRWMGHGNVSLLDGGFADWSRKGFTTENGRAPSFLGNFSGSPKSQLTIDSVELQDAMQSETAPLLVDARDSQRFRGLVEPIDTRAGHIPGARNFPMTKNLTEEGKWRPASAIRAALSDAFGADIRVPWIAMCGSGVTACHLAIAAEIADLAEPRLYAGSWSEWIRDPGRPVASEGESGVSSGPESVD